MKKTRQEREESGMITSSNEKDRIRVKQSSKLLKKQDKQSGMLLEAVMG